MTEPKTRSYRLRDEHSADSNGSVYARVPVCFWEVDGKGSEADATGRRDVTIGIILWERCPQFSFEQ
jgi:hypothetical protein